MFPARRIFFPNGLKDQRPGYSEQPGRIACSKQILD